MKKIFKIYKGYDCMRLEISKRDQESSDLKRENVSLKVFIFFLVIIICNLCIYIWKMEFDCNVNECKYQVITNVDKSDEFMSFEFRKMK